MNPRTVSAIVAWGHASSWLSIACGAHCVLTPLLSAFLPLAGLAQVLPQGLEGPLLGVAMAVSAVSIGWGARAHRRGLGLGLLALSGMAWLGARWATSSHSEVMLVALGSLGMVASHAVNRRACLSCPRCGDESSTADPAPARRRLGIRKAEQPPLRHHEAGLRLLYLAYTWFRRTL